MGAAYSQDLRDRNEHPAVVTGQKLAERIFARPVGTANANQFHIKLTDLLTLATCL